jgi:hypothetical protein
MLLLAPVAAFLFFYKILRAKRVDWRSSVRASSVSPDAWGKDEKFCISSQ